MWMLQPVSRGDIIKPGDKLGNTPGAPEGANYENHKKNDYF